jgi:nitrite reductase (NADH) large subunit
MREKLLVIGNGMASVRLLEELVAGDAGAFEITVVGAEPEIGYNRVLLSALLAGDVTPQDAVLRDASWYARHDIELVTGKSVVAVDTVDNVARLDDGTVLGFDRVVFATGSDAIRLPLPGNTLPGVISFRDTRDIAAMEAAAAAKKSVAVIGGGLLGLEAAYGLAKLGCEVTLVHVMDRLMERQLDNKAGAMLKRAISAKGVQVLLQKQTIRILGERKVMGLAFLDGSTLPCDIVVFAVGIRPNMAVAQAAGIAVSRGIMVDDMMRTSVPPAYALGECAEHAGTVYGLVEPAYAQAKVLAKTLLGAPSALFASMALATNLKVSGVAVFSAGDFMAGDDCETLTFEDRALGIYKKLVLREGKLVGAVLFGDTADGLWYRDLIRAETDIDAIRGMLLFGQHHSQMLRAA